MKRKLMVLVIWLATASVAFTQQIDLKALDKLAAKSKNKTEISMDEATVKSALGFLSQDKKDEAAVQRAVKDLKGLYLRVYEFDQKDAFKLDDLKPILDQLKSPGWTSFLRSQEDGEQVEIWMHRTNGQTDGLLLVSAEAGEVAVINALGMVRLEDLSMLGEIGS